MEPYLYSPFVPSWCEQGQLYLSVNFTFSNQTVVSIHQNPLPILRVSLIVIIQLYISHFYTPSYLIFYSTSLCKPFKGRVKYHLPFAGIIIFYLYLLTAIGLSPGGSGYFTCKQNMKLVITRFKSGGLHEKHVVATWNLGNHLSICL